MKEYTLLALASVFAAATLDKISKVNLLRKPFFYLFLAIIFSFKWAVNGYLTGTQIVMYNPSFFLGIRLGSIPLEDFMFGFSMVTITIIFWERFKR
jgi:lycopene cyclase domain-containing protein